MSAVLHIVDAFTAVPFRGNPAAVCRLDGSAEARWMQDLAAEMNLSETAYVWPLEGGRWSLRWFTPKVEVELCGHATLASAHTLWRLGEVTGDEVVFASRSGDLRARRRGDWIELDFPRRDALGIDPPQALLEALGVMPSFAGRTSEADYLLVLEDEEVVRSLRPDLALLAEVPARGVIVTAPAGAASEMARSDRRGDPDGTEAVWDFVSRFFAPAVGVPEDPVTGSAHCTLGPYWARRLRKEQLIGYQASPRGGLVRLDVGLERVLMGGQAVTVLEGTLAI